VTTRTPEMVDYSCRHTYDPGNGDKHGWDVDVHFVIRAGVSGVYIYTINSHPASYPEMSVGEWRMVWSPPDDLNDWLDTIYIDDARRWIIPAPGDRSEPVAGAPKEVTLYTQGTWANRLDCKYMYAASYAQIGCWGFASSTKHLGGFVVLPSTEFFNDGPNKQDLTAAVGTTLLHLNMNHYDGTGFRINHGQDWKKFYGPWLLYMDHSSTADGCWHQAQAQVKIEAAQWPYAWLKNPDYPLAAGRGTVDGQLMLRDALKPELTSAGAWIGLSPPADRSGGDFQFSASDYQFWTRIHPDGRFTITNVRPGTYTLYAYADGVVTQFEKPNITVRAGAIVPLNRLQWTVAHPGKTIVWEIGTPDRNSAEFGHGKDYYRPLMYKKLATEVPEPLDFTIGKSDPATDWYYAQAPHDDNGKAVPAHWRIHFELAQAPRGTSTLTLAFAGADRARLSVQVNDSRPVNVTPPVEGGNGLIREADHAKYSFAYVPIPADRLHAGENTITLIQGGGNVMYDYLSLETP
jgi:rhamnogalacturonan endolyase